MEQTSSHSVPIWPFGAQIFLKALEMQGLMVIVVCYNFPPFHGCSFLWVPSVTGMNMCLSGVLGWGFTDGRPSEFTAPLHREHASHWLPVRDVNSIPTLRNDLPPRWGMDLPCPTRESWVSKRIPTSRISSVPGSVWDKSSHPA